MSDRAGLEGMLRAVKEGLAKLLQEPAFLDSEAGRAVAALAGQLGRPTQQESPRKTVRFMGAARPRRRP